MQPSVNEEHQAITIQNLKLMALIEKTLCQTVDNPLWSDVANQNYINQRLGEITSFIGLSLADKEQD